ncbi:MAG: carboxypeptidase regulatory-like domain-containing protein [Nitrospirae bacterium]|nr:carboxypeptidase regulatory-like domain-containing protein [Nitrospirota bacterium]
MYIGYINGPPLSGATVTCGGQSTTTGSDGSYSLYNIFAGSNQTLSITASGYSSVNRPLSINAFPGANLYVGKDALTSSGSTGSITGNVYIGYINGPPLSGATVTCGGQSATTGSDGSYSIANIPAGNQTLSITASGYISVNRPLSISAGANLYAGKDALTASNSTCSITGNVYIGYINGPPLSGATVTCGGQSTTTISDGSYSIGNIPPGNQTLSITASVYSSVSRPLSISSGVDLYAGEDALHLRVLPNVIPFNVLLYP